MIGVARFSCAGLPLVRRKAGVASMQQKKPAEAPRVFEDGGQSRDHAGRGRRLHQMFETHDVLVSDAQKDVVVVPEHRPSVFPVYLSRLNLALELKFVAAEVDSICLCCSHFVRQLPSSCVRCHACT